MRAMCCVIHRCVIVRNRPPCVLPRTCESVCMITTLPSLSLRRWRRAAAVLLLGVLCVQLVPLQLIHRTAPAHHECAERGFCPRNPGGPCVCDHHSSEAGHGHSQAPAADEHAPRTPTLQTCGSPMDAPLLSNGLVKGVVAAIQSITTPTFADQWGPPADSLTPQQRGADIFRPPRLHLG